MPVKMDTWEDVLEICQFFNGKDWNGDGKPDDGITLHLKVGGQGFFHYHGLLGAVRGHPRPRRRSDEGRPSTTTCTGSTR